MGAVHENDDGRVILEKHEEVMKDFTSLQRFCHFDFLENQNGYRKIQVIEVRKKAYKAESDPLYMEWQFDQTSESEQAWRDKVTEIKARYPLAETE